MNKLTDEEAESLFFDCPDMVSEEILDHRRWSVVTRKVFKMPDGTFYQVTMNMGATENQDHYMNCHGQVVPLKKTVTVYEDLV